MLSAIILIGITIIAVSIVYNSGVPILKKLQEASEVERMKEAFSKLNDVILDVASGGNGTRRVIYLGMNFGRFWINKTRDCIYWELKTPSHIVSPRTRKIEGNLIFGSNLEVYANETEYKGEPAYLLENEYLKVYLRKFGSPGNPEPCNTKDMLLSVYNKHTRTFLNLDSLEISIDNQSSSQTGQCFTLLSPKGYNLPSSTVTFYINSNYIDYYVNFTLLSGTDFLIIQGGLI